MKIEQVHAKGWTVITGASSGIGYELAKVFAEEGYDLVVVAEDAGIHEAAHAFRKQGHQVRPLQIDLAGFDGVEELYAEVRGLGDSVDCVVLNAGVGVSGVFAETDLTKELNMLQLNVLSVVHLTKRILPDFIARGTGQILFTSSIAAQMPGPYYAVYAASKAFVQSFSEAIAYEVRDHHITVTALQPGATETNFFARADMLDTKAGRGKKDDPALVARQGYDALQAGKDHVVGGALANKINAIMSKFLSESQGAAMQAKSTIPFSEKEKRKSGSEAVYIPDAKPTSH